MSENPLIEWLPELMEALKAQLESDEKRWGDEWRHRPVKAQARRTYARIREYLGEWPAGGLCLPWLKVIGGAYICWIRLRHPEYALEPMKGSSCNDRPMAGAAGFKPDTKTPLFTPAQEGRIREIARRAALAQMQG